MTSTTKYDEILLNHRKTIVQPIEPYITNIASTDFFSELESIVDSNPENLLAFFKENKHKLDIAQLDNYKNYDVIYRNNTTADRSIGLFENETYMQQLEDAMNDDYASGHWVSEDEFEGDNLAFDENADLDDDDFLLDAPGQEEDFF